MNKLRKYSIDLDPISLREERRRTGRYVAVAIAICITLLGLYQAIVQHTPVVAGLFAPAIIMFLYVFWVLYTASKAASKQRRADAAAARAAAAGEDSSMEFENNILTEVTVNPISNDSVLISLPLKDINILPKEDNITADKVTRNKLSRTYSIA